MEQKYKVIVIDQFTSERTQRSDIPPTMTIAEILALPVSRSAKSKAGRNCGAYQVGIFDKEEVEHYLNPPPGIRPAKHFPGGQKSVILTGGQKSVGDQIGCSGDMVSKYFRNSPGKPFVIIRGFSVERMSTGRD